MNEFEYTLALTGLEALTTKVGIRKFRIKYFNRLYNTPSIWEIRLAIAILNKSTTTESFYIKTFNEAIGTQVRHAVNNNNMEKLKELSTLPPLTVLATPVYIKSVLANSLVPYNIKAEIAYNSLKSTNE